MGYHSRSLQEMAARKDPAAFRRTLRMREQQKSTRRTWDSGRTSPRGLGRHLFRSNKRHGGQSCTYMGVSIIFRAPFFVVVSKGKPEGTHCFLLRGRGPKKETPSHTRFRWGGCSYFWTHWARCRGFRFEGSLWAAVAVHWLPVCLWLLFLGGEQRREGS